MLQTHGASLGQTVALEHLTREGNLEEVHDVPVDGCGAGSDALDAAAGYGLHLAQWVRKEIRKVLGTEG